MIRQPRRSVTRFFIPLIDVLILLFCIFLLMPFVKTAGEGGDGNETPPRDGASLGPQPAPGDAAELARQLEQTRRQLERLKQEKAEALQRLSARVLEIDKNDGLLYYQDGDDRLKLATEADVLALVSRHQRELGGRGELYYLILYPRELSGFPQERQVQQYQRWFKDVPHGFDNPRAKR